jgi:hypothetical protein
MAYTAPTVNYSTTVNGTYTTLTGIQSVSISRGRQRFDDNFAGNSCVIELIPATTYATPLAIGQFIDVRTTNAGGSPAYFVGNITDINRKYAIPYDTSTAYAPADRITITAVGTTGALGKQTLSNITVIARRAPASILVISEALADAPVTPLVDNQYTARNSLLTLTNIGLLDLINGLLRTCQWFIDDIDGKRSNALGWDYFGATFPGNVSNTNYTFSDANTLNAYKFTDLQYQSTVLNTFTEVQVVASGLATQSATSGSAPYNTLVYNTYNETTADALSLAGYIINVQSVATAVPFSITTNTMVADTCIDMSVLTTTDVFGVGNFTVNLGSAVTVIFRGTTVTGQIQGINTTFYIDHASVQLFISPSLGTPFTLDSSAFGVLDTNRLGYP